MVAAQPQLPELFAARGPEELRIDSRLAAIDAIQKQRQEELAVGLTAVAQARKAVAEARKAIQWKRKRKWHFVKTKMMHDSYAKKIQAAIRGAISRRKIAEQSTDMAERLKRAHEREMQEMQSQVQATYTMCHGLRFRTDPEACYITIQRWFRALLAERVTRVERVFRGVAQHWRVAMRAARLIQRHFRKRASLARQRELLVKRREHSHAMTVSLASKIKSKATRAVAVTGARAVTAALVIQKYARMYIASILVEELRQERAERLALAPPPPPPPPPPRPETAQSEEAAEEELDLNVLRIQAQGLKPFYWTVDKVHHKIGGQPDQAKDAKKRKSHTSVMGPPGQRSLKQPQQRTGRRRKKRAARRKEEEPPDEYEYYDIYCGTRLAEEEQDLMTVTAAGEMSGKSEGMVSLPSTALMTSPQLGTQPTGPLEEEDEEGVFDMALQGDMYELIQQIPPSGSAFTPHHPLLGGTEWLLKHPGVVSGEGPGDSPLPSPTEKRDSRLSSSDASSGWDISPGFFQQRESVQQFDPRRWSNVSGISMAITSLTALTRSDTSTNPGPPKRLGAPHRKTHGGASSLLTLGPQGRRFLRSETDGPPAGSSPLPPESEEI